jgi:hypothetical protein
MSFSHLLVLFGLQDVEDVFGSVWDSWLRFSEQFEQVIASFFAAVDAPEMPVEDRFMNIVQAAEAYHRIANGGDIALRNRLVEARKRSEIPCLSE